MIARSRAFGPEKIAILKPPSAAAHLRVPLAGSLPVLEQECWLNAGLVFGFAHIELRPAGGVVAQHMARPSRAAGLPLGTPGASQ